MNEQKPTLHHTTSVGCCPKDPLTTRAMSSIENIDASSPGMGPKTIRSRAPDIVVSVGSGEAKREFQCYAVILSFASEYLDAMLSSSMKEGELGKIEFPDKDPEEWELFYNFIIPANMSTRSSRVNDETVLVLIPWFHEFQMNDFLQECDDYLGHSYLCLGCPDLDDSFWQMGRLEDESEEEHQVRLKERKVNFGKILAGLIAAIMYDLPYSKDVAESHMADLLIRLAFLQVKDLFDFPTVKSLDQLVRPLLLDDETGLRMGGGESTYLWPAVKEIISPHLSNLSQEMIDDDVLFPHLFHSYIQIKAAEDRCEAATDMVKSIVNVFPGDISRAGFGQNASAWETFKKVMNDHYNSNRAEFESLGIELPSLY